MKHLRHISYGILALLLAITCYAGKPITGIAETRPSLAPMLQKIMPTIVNISVRGEVPADSSSPQDKQRRHNGSKNNSRFFEDLGSGVIIDAENGYIVTNAHVVKDAQSITVTLSDDRSMRANVIGYDPPSDIAVIKIAAKRLKNAIYGDSDKLKVGDFVCAIGSPFGLQKTVTSGVVSGLERNDLGIESFESFIQTDASINPGSSGGALVNMQGELVGINTAFIGLIPSSSGIGLAIPSNMTKNIVEQIIKYGKVKRGTMGITIQNITPALAEAMHLKEAEGGALVSQVIEGSPAAAAGLHPKDVIIKIMGKSVHSAAQITNVASLANIGSKVTLQVCRDNKLINLEPIIADPEDLKKTQEAPKNLLSGLWLKNFNLLLDNQQIKGVEVLYVDDASVAYSCGLRPTDVILTAANQPVTTVNQLQAIANKNPKQLLLEIKRGLSGNFFLVLEE